ncbi:MULTISPECIES: phosphoadenosine phosphosulfate reductase family protein [Kitasatospora]|uniref:Phosphoadenosine phosphosulfate reductase family protein n=1 Tax=Kitasatospora cineracea TaxID=88074 RepID=A0A8G1UIT6_9ACTN|nr:phosphoadenosine phosphosulfate reductase family protein [Kitasatospora cineracea]ROR44757.1 phosphoadenosine phosphosulfate reductase family protein [Kitasatospora cineracea]
MSTTLHIPPQLRNADAYVLNNSAGKDSAAMLHLWATNATDEMLERTVVLHLDLGTAEWPGVPALAAQQAAAYGLPYEVRRRERGHLLDLVRERGRWPGPSTPFCRSYLKRDVARKFYTELTGRLGVTGRPAHIVTELGLRAAESSVRARRPAVALDRGASSGRRQVTTWLPIHQLGTDAVWKTVRASGIPPHPVYQQLDRLSCKLCPFAGRRSLITAARMAPDTALDYALVEDEIGVPFRRDLSMAEIITAAGREEPGPVRAARPYGAALRTPPHGTGACAA